MLWDIMKFKDNYCIIFRKKERRNGGENIFSYPDGKGVVGQKFKKLSRKIISSYYNMFN
jgi:hypothetical protein